ncbi:exodeoxyribonuclease III [Gordonia sp. X0973]|uniref:exodeoxyribonuclease III n=1 Tax=Gordonia sp. X0973 TaxID=2742602 RepID=UPI000F549CEC|nr:exodeoxyribonuclease III [Gordonia sp. X0973]QKT08265.1 exodeoxyribonuclease III [Gordonia sp. X0973]
MRVATWNVNSLAARVPRVVPWLTERRPDVVCLQETKLDDAGFDAAIGAQLDELGYRWAHHGQGQWNGVALLSRVGLDDVQLAFPQTPGYPDPAGTPEARAVSAVCGGVRVYSLYVPNGREVGTDHYEYKLAWLAALRDAVVGAGPASALVCGDINIAPADDDVYDPAAYVGHTHVTDAERAALGAVVADAGLVDVIRRRWPDERVFSYWDYRAGMFHKDLGMRIDLILAGADVAPRVAAAFVDRQARKGSKPSDHAPVIVDLDDAPDGDIGPVVPPPSNPAKRSGAGKPPQARR